MSCYTPLKRYAQGLSENVNFPNDKMYGWASISLRMPKKVKKIPKKSTFPAPQAKFCIKTYIMLYIVKKVSLRAFRKSKLFQCKNVRFGVYRPNNVDKIFF